MAQSKDYEFKRGDTKVLDKFRLLNADGEVLKLGTNDTLYFTVKKDANSKNVLIQKTTKDSGISLEDDGYYHIILDPEDTNDLDYGDYQYDIELKSIGSRTFVRTLVEGVITLTEEITWGGDE